MTAHAFLTTFIVRSFNKRVGKPERNGPLNLGGRPRSLEFDEKTGEILNDLKAQPLKSARRLDDNDNSVNAGRDVRNTVDSAVGEDEVGPTREDHCRHFLHIFLCLLFRCL